MARMQQELIADFESYLKLIKNNDDETCTTHARLSTYSQLFKDCKQEIYSAIANGNINSQRVNEMLEVHDFELRKLYSLYASMPNNAHTPVLQFDYVAISKSIKALFKFNNNKITIGDLDVLKNHFKFKSQNLELLIEEMLIHSYCDEAFEKKLENVDRMNPKIMLEENELAILEANAINLFNLFKTATVQQPELSKASIQKLDEVTRLTGLPTKTIQLFKNLQIPARFESIEQLDADINALKTMIAAGSTQEQKTYSIVQIIMALNNIQHDSGVDAKCLQCVLNNLNEMLIKIAKNEFDADIEIKAAIDLLSIIRENSLSSKTKNNLAKKIQQLSNMKSKYVMEVFIPRELDSILAEARIAKVNCEFKAYWQDRQGKKQLQIFLTILIINLFHLSHKVLDDYLIGFQFASFKEFPCMQKLSSQEQDHILSIIPLGEVFIFKALGFRVQPEVADAPEDQKLHAKLPLLRIS